MQVNVAFLNRADRQKVVLEWAEATFGEVALDLRERALRLVEEAIELAQASGVECDAICGLVGHVYAKPPGEPEKELGAVCVTLLAYAEAAGESAEDSEAREINRVTALDRNYRVAVAPEVHP